MFGGSYGAVGRNKNRTWTPNLNRNTRIDDEVNRICRDDCMGQPRAFPQQFQRVRDAPYGENFMLFWG